MAPHPPPFRLIDQLSPHPPPTGLTMLNKMAPHPPPVKGRIVQHIKADRLGSLPPLRDESFRPPTQPVLLRTSQELRLLSLHLQLKKVRSKVSMPITRVWLWFMCHGMLNTEMIFYLK